MPELPLKITYKRYNYHMCITCAPHVKLCITISSLGMSTTSHLRLGTTSLLCWVLHSKSYQFQISSGQLLFFSKMNKKEQKNKLNTKEIATKFFQRWKASLVKTSKSSKNSSTGKIFETKYKYYSYCRNYKNILIFNKV